MTDLAFQSATNLIAAIKSKKTTSSDLLEMYIERMQRLNPGINAIVATDLDNARKRAKEADEALARGEDWGPLHGLPITIKDSFEVEGMPCTSGSPDLKDYQPTRNAFVVQKLINAGAIVFGKTNLPLFAMDLQSYNDVYGQTNNPWNFDLGPGGSSGGSAAALAAGLTGLEIGSDIGGSIRNPAHFCGVFGHKPTFNIVPFMGHIPPPPGTYPGEYSGFLDIAVAGPLARSPKDLGLVMDLITAPRGPDRKAWKIELPPSRKTALKDFKIALCLEDDAFPTDAKVKDCLQNAADTLANAGAVITESKPDIDLASGFEIYHQLLASATSAGLPDEIFSGMLETAKTLSDDDHSESARRLRGSTALHRTWHGLDYARTMLREVWADFFKEFDVLLCPTVSVTAFPHDHSEDFLARRLIVNGEERGYFDTGIFWAGITNMCYLPATIAPAGLAKNGLPVGMQIVAPYLEDRTCLRFAEIMEEVVGGIQVPPGFEK